MSLFRVFLKPIKRSKYDRNDGTCYFYFSSVSSRTQRILVVMAWGPGAPAGVFKHPFFRHFSLSNTPRAGSKVMQKSMDVFFH